jgi:hypothetical protein
MALLATYSVIENLGDPARTLQKFLEGCGRVTSHRVIRIKLVGGGTAMAMDFAYEGEGHDGDRAHRRRRPNTSTPSSE